MRFRRTKHDRVLVVGIFQSPKTGRAVLKSLHRTHFRRAAAIHASARGRSRVEENGISAIGGSVAASVLSVALGAFIFCSAGFCPITGWPGWAFFFLALALGGVSPVWLLFGCLRGLVVAGGWPR